LDQGFSEITLSFSSIGTKGPILIASQIPLSIDSTKYLHPYFPPLVIYTTE